MKELINIGFVLLKRSIFHNYIVSFYIIQVKIVSYSAPAKFEFCFSGGRHDSCGFTITVRVLVEMLPRVSVAT